MSLCRKLDRLAKKFLGKSFLVSWDMVCKLRLLGGLGVRKFEFLNRAVVSYLAWCLASNLDRLCVRALKPKYFPNCHFLYFAV